MNGDEFLKVQAKFGGKRRPDTSINAVKLLNSVIRRAKALRKPESIQGSCDIDFMSNHLPYEIAIISIPVSVLSKGKQVPPPV